jgi:osmotically inducible protein OsmC
MAEIKRRASAVWRGDLRGGDGDITTESGVLSKVAYSFSTRFEDEPGSNPEELIASAHAACFSMAFANTLAQKGHNPKSVETHATCVLTSKDGGFEITRMILESKVDIAGLNQAELASIAEEADQGCPVSNLLREGLTIELEATLV